MPLPIPKPVSKQMFVWCGEEGYSISQDDFLELCAQEVVENKRYVIKHLVHKYVTFVERSDLIHYFFFETEEDLKEYIDGEDI